MNRIVKFLLPEGTIGRAGFVVWGVLLAGVKFNLDRFVAYFLAGEAWSLSAYERAWAYAVDPLGQPTSQSWRISMLVLAIPFIWAGMTFTVKRLRSAGLPLWLSFLFFAPVIKFLFFAVLAVVPPRSIEGLAHGSTIARKVPRWMPRTRVGAALASAGLTSIAAAAVVWFGTHVLESYGWALFAGLPFCMGFLSSLLLSLHGTMAMRDALAAATLSCLFVGGVLLAVALEGFICILMAAPLALGLALAGAVFGCVVAGSLSSRGAGGGLFCVPLLVLPMILAGEKAVAPLPEVRPVTTSVLVNATVQTVWSNVVSFPELPAPTETHFRMGIAYPIRAEIRGSGVGAIRFCQFSTGPFVEPITVWDEPRLLRFNVTSNPPPMREWSPYSSVDASHLHGFMESEQGQFLITPLPNGGTLLEGTTWYRHGLWPDRYWRFWSDRIIHSIHRRVLNHIQGLSETRVGDAGGTL